MAPCLFSEAVVYRLACSAGTSSAAAASTVSRRACVRPARLNQAMTAPAAAATTMTPVHDQKCMRTVTGASVPGARSSVVMSIPCR